MILFDSVYFTFAGERSIDKDVFLVSIDSGLKSTPFLPEREIISETVPGNDIPYVYGVRRSPLTTTITLSTLDNAWTLEKRREIARWLDTGKFEEFYSQDNEDKRYYFMYVGGIDLTYNGEMKGYITLQVQNIAPYAFSPVYTDNYDLSTITTTTEITFDNDGDDHVFPELWIKKISAGDVSIVNVNDGGKEFKFAGLADQETVYVDNKLRHIETDLADTYRHDNFNNNYLRLTPGVNRLNVTGACLIDMRYQFIIKG